MKKTRMTAAILALSLSTSIITTPAQAATTQSQNTETRQTVQSTKDKFYVAGFTQKEFNTYFTKLQKAVAKNDKKTVSKLVYYPLNVNSNGKTKVIKNQKQFIKEYKTIMTKKVKNSVLKQKSDKVFVNYKGAMTGSGEVWISKFNKKLGIYGINK